MAHSREQRRAYRQSERGQEAEQRYRQSPRGKALARERTLRYLGSPKGVLWKKRNAWKYRIKKNFGITGSQWEAMLIAQAGRCAVCWDPMVDPHTDHNHATGAVRDLLCHVCNPKLAAVEDAGFLSAALAYLERHKSNPQ